MFLDGFKIPLQAQKCSNCKACPYEKHLLGVCLSFLLTNLLQTLPLGQPFLLCFSPCSSSNIKCFFDQDLIWGMECLSLFSLFFMCLECAGMYVNTFQSPDSLFFFPFWTCHCLTASFQFLLELCKFQQDFFYFFILGRGEEKIIAIR